MGKGMAEGKEGGGVGVRRVGNGEGDGRGEGRKKGRRGGKG
jgi:hypothetical protein